MLATRKQEVGEKSNIPALDGVRAIACLSVIEYHVHYLMSYMFNLTRVLGRLGSAIVMAGWSGVTLFFVLSGFLLFMPYAKHLLFGQQWPSTRTFYWRRILRIWPGYFLALFLLLPLCAPQYFQPDHLGGLGLFLTFLMDAPPTYQQINGPFWTLAVEWQFYLLLPLLAWGFSLFARRGVSPQQRFRRVVICLSCMILWGIGTRYAGGYFTTHPTATLFVPRSVLNAILLVIYGSSGKYLEDFAVGMLCCAIYIYTCNAASAHKMSRTINRSSPLLWGAGVLLLFFMAGWSAYYAQLSFLDPFIGAHSFLTELGFACGFSLCIIAILFGQPGLRLIFAWQPMRWIGAISYSLYLWHLPLLLFFRNSIISKLPQVFLPSYLLYWACVLLVIIPAAYLLYRFVEQPFMQLGHRQARKEMPPSRETAAPAPIQKEAQTEREQVTSGV